MKNTIKGYVLFDGKSELNGRDIIAIATLNSKNEKTGPMQQLWILDKHTAPHIAAKEGKNDSVCGDCPIKDQCYVTLHQAPLSVWNAYHRGIYDTSFIDGTNNNLCFYESPFTGIDVNMFSQWILRFGAYGDPAALPKWLIVMLTKLVKDYTGYTHQWNKPQFAYLSRYFMASVESTDLAKQAAEKGFRTFRVKSKEMPVNDQEIVCLADSRGITCRECKLCNGSKMAKNIVIDAHGAKSKGIIYA